MPRRFASQGHQTRAWPARLGVALLACTLTLVLEWQRPAFVSGFDEALRDAALHPGWSLLHATRQPSW